MEHVNHVLQIHTHLLRILVQIICNASHVTVRDQCVLVVIWFFRSMDFGDIQRQALTLYNVQMKQLACFYNSFIYSKIFSGY